MKFKELHIEGVYIIEPEPFKDERGIFRRHFCFDEFNKVGIANNVLQANISENNYKYTLRGFHYQINPHSEGKTMSCLQGAMYDIIVDLRPESKTYLQWISVELSSKNRLSLHIPPGCANSFLTLENDTLIQYYCSNYYNPKFEKGIRYNDPFFKFDWPNRPLHISEKDASWPDFDQNNA
tara:strand:- start:144 stop:683 length:540 start_codon:yes stop_codon:yes gene_type:complete